MLDGILAKMSDDQTAGVQTTQDELRQALANRFGHKNPNDPESIFNRKPISLASILDPRYKLLFCPPGMKLALKGQIVKLSKLATAARSATSAAAASAGGSYSQTASTSTDVSDVLSTTQSQPESAEGTEGVGVIKVEDVWQSVFDTFATAAEQVGQEGSNETSEDELEIFEYAASDPDRKSTRVVERTCSTISNAGETGKKVFSNTSQLSLFRTLVFRLRHHLRGEKVTPVAYNRRENPVPSSQSEQTRCLGLTGNKGTVEISQFLLNVCFTVV
jgi:hypothetical protein